MRIFNFLLVLLFLLSLAACGGGEADTTGSGTGTATSDALSAQMQNRDSLRRLFHKYMAAKEDTLPLRPIVEAGKLYPVDEAPRDTAFFVFRERLLEAARRREVFHLMDVIHPEIKVDFGGGTGVADFVSSWQLDSPEKAKNSPVWEILERVLGNGGAFGNGGNRFTAPYVFALWPASYDAFEYVAITGSGVRLRSAPNLQSQTLTMVSYDVVRQVERSPVEETIGGETHPWVKIRLADEKEGFIYGKYVASSTDYRAGFERQADGKWRMTFLVAGD